MIVIVIVLYPVVREMYGGEFADPSEPTPTFKVFKDTIFHGNDSEDHLNSVMKISYNGG